MCDDTSPCDLSAVLGTKKDNLDDWSISLSESMHPHYRYRVVCSKWGKLWVIGSGFGLREAHALAAIFSEACAQARPREDSWTRPILRFERVSPPIRERAEVGDLAFAKHVTNHVYRPDGSLSSYTERQMIGFIDELDTKNRVTRLRGFSGTVIHDPEVSRSYSRDDVRVEEFIAHVQEELDGRSERERYDYLTSKHCLEETILRFACTEVAHVPIDLELAVQCIRTVSLPIGHQTPVVDTAQLRRQVDAVTTRSRTHLLAA